MEFRMMHECEQSNSNYDFPVVWVKCQEGQLPKGLNPVFGGLSVENGEPSYVARAVHQGNIIPGRFVPSKGKCYVGHGLLEHAYSEYQVLTKPAGTNLEWLLDQDGHVPDGAVVGGRQSDGTKLYIGRVYYDGFGNCGKVHCEHKVLYIPLNGKEYSIKKYQVLAISDKSSLKWIDCENGQVPSSQLNPVLSGITPEGEPTYVGRAHHSHHRYQGRYGHYEMHLIPGRVVPSQSKCHVGHGLKVHSYSQYQVLTNPLGAKLEWVPDHNGHVPDGAVVGGRQSDGTKLFVGRAYHDGFGISGKVHCEHKVLYIASGGTEWSLRKYEVLVDTELATTTSNINHGVTM